MTDAEAVRTFQSTQARVALLTHEKPRLQEVRIAIAGDCRAKAGAEIAAASQAQYCYCAGVLTTALWYGNKEMRDRLDAFARAAAGDPKELLRFQGPELYGPFCHKVIVGMATTSH